MARGKLGIVLLWSLWGSVLRCVAKTTRKTILISSPGNEDTLEKIEYELQEQILAANQTENPAVKDIEYDNIDYYITDFPTEFAIGIIVNPCFKRNPGCCQDIFGTPTYIVRGSEIASPIGAPQIRDRHGNTLLIEVSRIGDRYSVWDPECFVTPGPVQKPYRRKKVVFQNGSIAILEVFDDPYCVGRLQALTQSEEVIMPSCWDHNESVNALDVCYAADGLKRPYCVSIGYTQTAMIAQCGGKYSLDNHCGTFLELHAENDKTILAQTRLLAEYTSGYRTTTLPMYYKGSRTKTVCRGNYEIWWVLRTRYNFIVQHVKKFRVTEPWCDFDSVTNLYTDFHTIKTKHSSTGSRDESATGT